MEINELTEFLSPVAGNETYDYVLYGMFVLGMITLAFMGKGSTQMDTLFVTFSVFMIVLDKLYITGFIFTEAPPGVEITAEQRVATHIDHLFTYLLRVGIFVLPLVVAGNTKSGRVRVLAGLFAIVGVCYSFGRWFFQIRENANDGPGFGMSPMDSPEMIAMQGGLLLIVVGELAYRWYAARRDNATIDYTVAETLEDAA